MSGLRAGPLIDLDALMPDSGHAESMEAKPPVTEIPMNPCQSSIPNASRGYGKSSNGNGFGDGIPKIPRIPIETAPSGTGTDENDRAAAGLQAVFRAAFPPSPSALLLLLGWFAERPGATVEDLAGLLAELVTEAPGEQVRTWHNRCRSAGLDPVELLALPAPSEGTTCDNCRHLDTHCGYLPNDGRRRFRWACGLGYKVMEFGRGTERILIAPPECGSWERWYPGPWR